MRKEARKPEEAKKANLEKKDQEKDKVSTLNTAIKAQDTYSISTGKSETSNLLGFQGDYEEPFAERRGGFRGGRGGARGGSGRGGAGGRGRGAKKDWDAMDNETDFPTL